MKKLLIVHAGGNLERLLHEVSRGDVHEVGGIITPNAPISGIPHFHDLPSLPEDVRAGAVFFVCGDESLLNQNRLSSYMEVKKKGWSLVSLVSAGASIAPDIKLRENVYFDHGARVLAGANIGANCWVMQGSEVGANSQLGSSCWIGAHCRIAERAVLGKNCTLGDGVVIGPDVVLPPWSKIDRHGVLAESPATTIFTDSRFKSPVFFFDRSSS